MAPFSYKDAFTLFNLGAGVVALYELAHGHARAAGYWVMIGYVLGDLFDGAVARATRTSNAFGGELDAIVDHFVHVVVPALILAEVYRGRGHEVLGLAIGGFLLATATIRHARLASEPFSSKQAWCGLPRTVSGFAAMSLPLSIAFFDDNPARIVTTTAVIAVLSMLNVIPIPYATHRGARKLSGASKVLAILWLVSPLAVFLIDRAYVFDLIFVWCAGYTLLGWAPLTKDERVEFATERTRWLAAVAQQRKRKPRPA